MNQLEFYLDTVVDASQETQMAREARDHAAKRWQRSQSQEDWGQYLALLGCWASIKEENTMALDAI